MSDISKIINMISTGIKVEYDLDGTIIELENVFDIVDKLTEFYNHIRMMTAVLTLRILNYY